MHECIIGSTALVALIRGTELAVANVGDSRGVLCDMDGKSRPLSFDHKPHEALFNLHLNFLSSVSILTRDIDIAVLSVCP